MKVVEWVRIGELTRREEMMAEEVMTPETFTRKMKELYADTSTFPSCDIEDMHGKADDLMCEALRSLGYGEGVEFFENSTRWYA